MDLDLVNHFLNAILTGETFATGCSHGSLIHEEKLSAMLFPIESLRQEDSWKISKTCLHLDNLNQQLTYYLL